MRRLRGRLLAPGLAGVLATVTAVLPAACGRSPALARTADSPVALAGAVLDALDRRDMPTLRALALSEAEFRNVVWPKLPGSRPERRLPWEYAWENLRGKSERQLAARVAHWMTGWSVVRVAFTGETTDYGTYRVHRKSVVTLQRHFGGQTTARLFGSIIEQDGRYKVFSYVAD